MQKSSSAQDAALLAVANVFPLRLESDENMVIRTASLKD